MVPDFRDETIGFRCARSGGEKEAAALAEKAVKTAKSAPKD
jgi:hypothetical protein